MLRTYFNPGFHGYHFSNSDIKCTVFGFPLCGGMAYSALDYFWCSYAIPSYTVAPVGGTTIHDYIYKRQLNAHGNTISKFIDAWMSAPDAGSEYQKLKTFIQRGSPIPICLTGTCAGHHLLGIGCDPSRIVISAYDPNYPEKTVTLEQIASGQIRNNWDRQLWRGFFVDDRYRYAPPPFLSGLDWQENWRGCRYCGGLFFSPSPSNGMCPTYGGQHFWTGSEYIIDVGTVGGGEVWKWCRKCSALFSFGERGKCPSGGSHDGSTSGSYFLTQYSTGLHGHRNWRRCIKCGVLVFFGASAIKCAAGGIHHPSNREYVLTWK